MSPLMIPGLCVRRVSIPLYRQATPLNYFNAVDSLKGACTMLFLPYPTKRLTENAPKLGNIDTLEDMRREIILDIGRVFKSREAALRSLRACRAYCEANCSSYTMLRADWNRIEAVCSEPWCAFKCTISSRIQPSYMWAVVAF